MGEQEPKPQRLIIAVDPGEVNNGFVLFKYDPERKMADVRIMSILSVKQLDKMLKTVWDAASVLKPENVHFVVENFRVDTHVRQREKEKQIFQWSEVVTIRQIGKVEMLAGWLDASFTLQEPANVLTMGRKWGPWRKLPKHIPDDKAAYLHGASFMMDRNWINTVDQITMNGQERLG